MSTSGWAIEVVNRHPSVDLPINGTLPEDGIQIQIVKAVTIKPGEAVQCDTGLNLRLPYGTYGSLSILREYENDCLFITNPIVTSGILRVTLVNLGQKDVNLLSYSYVFRIFLNRTEQAMCVDVHLRNGNPRIPSRSVPLRRESTTNQEDE